MIASPAAVSVRGSCAGADDAPVGVGNRFEVGTVDDSTVEDGTFEAGALEGGTVDGMYLDCRRN